MGKKSDRQFRTRLAGSTALAPSRVFALAQHAAAEAKGGGVKLNVAGMLDSSRLHLEMRSTGMAYAFKGINAAGKQGGITVIARPSGQGTEVLVHLESGLTSQATVALVPVTAKKAVGFEAHQAYLSTLHRYLVAEDPAAQLVIRDDERLS